MGVLFSLGYRYFWIIVLFGQGDEKVRKVRSTVHTSNRNVTIITLHSLGRVSREARGAEIHTRDAHVLLRYRFREQLFFSCAEDVYPGPPGVAPRGLRTERELGGGRDGAGPLADEVKVRHNARLKIH